jgi:hypothetical protein
MRGFATGDEIDFWPAWRAEDTRAKGVRATLLNWDQDGITISLERESGMWSFIPWCQVRLICKAIVGSAGIPEPGQVPSFAWSRSSQENQGAT